jgi:hypothetical protein
MTEIWKQYEALQKQRREQHRILTAKWDQEYYYPTLKQLQEQCLTQYGSHDKTRYWDNGLGWEWWYCGRCGARHSMYYYYLGNGSPFIDLSE